MRAVKTERAVPVAQNGGYFVFHPLRLRVETDVVNPDSGALHPLLFAFVGEVPAGQHGNDVVVGQFIDADCLRAHHAIDASAAGIRLPGARVQCRAMG